MEKLKKKIEYLKVIIENKCPRWIKEKILPKLKEHPLVCIFIIIALCSSIFDKESQVGVIFLGLLSCLFWIAVIYKFINRKQPYNETVNGEKAIYETKVTCQSCGHVSYYGKTEELDQASAANHKCMKLACCMSCFIPALLFPDKKVLDLNKCPQCNSIAIEKEVIKHVLDK